MCRCGPPAWRTGWAPAPGFAWQGSTPALLALAAATLLELLGYYLPLLDHLLDTLATPAALGAGALLMASSLPQLDPTTRWVLGVVVGGGAAGLVQGSTVLLRAGSTATTGGRANPLLATLENGLALGGTALALLPPLVAAGLALALLLCSGSRWRRWQRRRAATRLAAAQAPIPPGFA